MAKEKDKGMVDRSKDISKAISSARKEREDEAAPQEYIGTHKVVAGDTMSGIALKFYGSAVREKWMAIYEANKELIGDNPALIHPGQELKIPKLAD